MPNRNLKPSIRTSERLNKLTDFQFRLWVHLITYVDDYGRGDARLRVVKGNCFPLRDRITLKDVGDAMNELAGAGCIVLYEVDGRPYLCFPSWKNHQRIQSAKSDFPEPPADAMNKLRSFTVGHGESPWVTVEENDVPLSPTPPNSSQNDIYINNISPSVKDKEGDNEEKNKGCGEKERKPKRESKAFVKPTVEEVAAYCKERKNGIDAEAFVAHYESNGWMVGKNPMKNWHMSVITWEKNRTVGGNYKGRESSKPDKYDYGTEADYDEYGFPIGKGG